MSSVNLKIKQGSTFSKLIGYYAGEEVVVSITSVTRGYPTLITAVAHGLPAGTHPAWIAGTKPWLNSASLDEKDMRFVTMVDADTLSIRIDSSALAVVPAGGKLVYLPPVDLSGKSGRMQIRRSAGSSEVLHTITTDDNMTFALGSIALVIGAADTAAFDFSTAVYDVEVIDGALDDTNATVTRPFGGPVAVSKEITR